MLATFRRFAVVLVCQCLIFTQGHAQSATFGKISLEELTRRHDDKDSTASAVILSDAGKSYFEYMDGFRIRHTREVRLKIFNKQGLERANITIPYYTKNPREIEIVKDIEASTYNIKDGQISKTSLDKHAIYDTKVIDKWSEKTFALPDVKEGSVIEYKYTVISPFIFNFRDWQFQYDIPVKWSEYEAKIPAFYDYQMLYQGFQQLTISDVEVLRGQEQLGSYQYQHVRYKWALKDIPAFKDESFITTEQDYIAKMTFQLSKVNYPGRSVKEYMTTWPSLIKDFMDMSDFGKHLKKKDGQDLLVSLTAGLSSDMEKACAIYQYVNSEIAWDGKASIYPAKTPKNVLEEKRGNCSEINILLINMLNMAGIEAVPVLISTRQHGHVNVKFPLIDEFNYALAYAKIDGNGYLLDGTDKELPLGMIPTQCINGYGLMLDPKQENWLRLYSGSEYYVATSVLCRYDTTAREFVAQVSHVYKGYAAAMHRKKLKASAEELEVAEGRLMSSADVQIVNMDSIDQHLQVIFKTPYEADILGNNIFINAAAFGPIHEQPFKNTERHFPIDYGYNSTLRYTFNLEIPDGYEVEDFPETVTMALEDKSVQFVLQTQQNGKNVQMLGIVRISTPVIDPIHYTQLREIYSTILAKYSQNIALKKTVFP